jgi:hypothetical protein
VHSRPLPLPVSTRNYSDRIELISKGWIVARFGSTRRAGAMDFRRRRRRPETPGVARCTWFAVVRSMSWKRSGGVIASRAVESGAEYTPVTLSVKKPHETGGRGGPFATQAVSGPVFAACPGRRRYSRTDRLVAQAGFDRVRGRQGVECGRYVRVATEACSRAARSGITSNRGTTPRPVAAVAPLLVAATAIGLGRCARGMMAGSATVAADSVGASGLAESWGGCEKVGRSAYARE